MTRLLAKDFTMIMINRERVSDEEHGDEPKFAPGQLVKHRRYGYRGVVVDFDVSCQASDDWYMKNQTQPDRDQPWYHVLVHQSSTVTYAAQTSLMADDSGEAIVHPLLDHFFSDFHDGWYIRNDEPWMA